MKCSVCGTTDRSAFSKAKTKRKTWYCKRCAADRRNARRMYYKKKAVLLLGGKCSVCGYDKNIAALDFHHIHGKDVKVSDICGSRSWSRIEEEIARCVLLCACCHREEHKPNGSKWKDDGFIDIADAHKWEDYEPQCHIPLPVKTCPVCGKDFKARRSNGNGKEQICCSLRCAGKRSRKVDRPSKSELKGLYDRMTQRAIAKTYGVSDVCVSKWARAYGLK